MARLFVTVLLLAAIGPAGFADEKRDAAILPKTDSVLAQNPDGTFNFRIFDRSKTPRRFSITARIFYDVKRATDLKPWHGVDCFHLDTYYKRRVDNSDETVAAGKTTCTSSAYVRLQPTRPASEAGR